VPRMFRLFTFAAISGALFIAAGPASATHSWSGYHWSRPSNPFTVTLGNNLTSNWTPYLTTAGSDWSITSGACNNPQNPIRCSVTSGGSGGRKCRPTAGRVEVCNSTYGNNGWLGHRSSHHPGHRQGERYLFQYAPVQHARLAQLRDGSRSRAHLRSRPSGRELQQS